MPKTAIFPTPSYLMPWLEVSPLKFLDKPYLRVLGQQRRMIIAWVILTQYQCDGRSHISATLMHIKNNTKTAFS